MGLTVHYSLRLSSVPARSALRLVEKLRRRALALPFLRVGPIWHHGPKSPHSSRDLPEWFRNLIEMHAFVKNRRLVFPLRAYAFDVHPGRGSETSSFGLLNYPRFSPRVGRGRVAVKRSGWYWQDFCKTQYASNPRYGGWENFRRCHLALIALLDKAAELGLKAKVTDESNFADHRDLEKLRVEIVEWNEMIAGLGGRLKDACPGEMDAPILLYPDFEHLEARSQRKETVKKRRS